MSEPCGNPICSNSVNPEAENRWRRTPKKFCSETCKLDGWSLKRVRRLLELLPAKERDEILFGEIKSKTNGEQNQREIDMGVQGNDHCEIATTKSYLSTWQGLTIGKIKFNDGRFTTADPAVQLLIESRPYFGIQVVEIGSNHRN